MIAYLFDDIEFAVAPESEILTVCILEPVERMGEEGDYVNVGGMLFRVRHTSERVWGLMKLTMTTSHKDFCGVAEYEDLIGD